MASSSSCAQSKSYVYDVFLSFCGEDTRKTFVDHLYDALDRQGICTFKDDKKLERGKKISDELLQSIEDSRCFIIVFSKNYASSSWCLNELLKIMECHKTGERITFPVFYDVDPSEVRKQTGAVGEALDIHTDKDDSEVENWREALKAAADLSGWDVRKIANGHEAQVIKIIVKEVLVKLSPFDIHVDENLVGMEKRMEALDPSLEIGTDDVRMIGIKGMGGAGKTTLARAIFDKLSITFEGKSFVENVREKTSKFGLEKLQEQVLRDVLKDKHISVQDVHDGKILMKKRLRSTKVLIVLDDVDCEEQLEGLAGDVDWFKPGSRIIITTRDEQVLNIYIVKWIHHVNLLSMEDAIRLFSRHAFKKNIPTQEHKMQSHEVVRYADGLPLTIKVLGSFLHGKNESEWSDALARLKTIPLKETLEVLKLSYESLENDYKNIFLDVACFLRDWKEDDAIRMLENYGCHAKNALKVLEKKSLLTLNKSYGSFIQMHDHLIELGQNIVRGEHLDEPNKHSRLWIQEDIKQVLADNSGSEATRCIILKVSHCINLKGLENMKKLRCLIVNHGVHKPSYNLVNRPWYYFGRLWKHDKDHRYFPNSLRYLYWAEYPHWRLPKTFDANNLVALEMPHSKIKLWKGEKVMKKLRFLDLSHSKLRRLDLGLTPNLEWLNLEDCVELVKLDVQGGCLKSLVYLNLKYCHSLKSMLWFEQLESLDSLYYTKVKHLLGSICMLKHLKTLVLSKCYDLEKLHEDVGQLESLEILYLSYCPNLREIPNSICKLKHLKTLLLDDCHYLEKLPEDVGQLESLEKLDLRDCTNLREIPNSICMLKHLKTLDLSYCYFLEKLPKDVGQLESLEILNLKGCINLREIPNSICMLKHLQTIDLSSYRYLEKLPDDVGQLESLEKLDLSDCTNLREIPNSICMLKHLKTLNLSGCELLEKLPEDVGQLESLEKLYLRHCFNLKEIPNSICMLKHLTTLILSSCILEKLPEDVRQLESLEILN